MPSITIKNIPEPLYRAMKAKAAANHRSLNGETLVALESHTGQPALPKTPGPIDFEAWDAEIDALHARHRLPALSVEEIEAAIEDGRP